MAQYKLLQLKEIPGGNIFNICKVDQTTCTASLLKQGYFLYLCTPVHHLLPQLTVCKFQLASGGNKLISYLNESNTPHYDRHRSKIILKSFIDYVIQFYVEAREVWHMNSV